MFLHADSSPNPDENDGDEQTVPSTAMQAIERAEVLCTHRKFREAIQTIDQARDQLGPIESRCRKFRIYRGEAKSAACVDPIRALECFRAAKRQMSLLERYCREMADLVTVAICLHNAALVQFEAAELSERDDEYDAAVELVEKALDLNARIGRSGGIKLNHWLLDRIERVRS